MPERDASTPRRLMKSRPVLMALFLATGVLSGYVACKGFAINLKTSRIVVPGTGTFYRIQLPAGVSDVADVQTMYLDIPGADDFVRASINNYVVADSDTKCALTRAYDDCVKNPNALPEAVDRGHGTMLGQRSIQFFVKPGLNQLVIELENGRFAYCGLQSGLSINGKTITGIPHSIPVRGGPRALLPESRWTQDPDSYTKDSLCAREIYQFELSDKER
jgi:hypothetical protein